MRVGMRRSGQSTMSVHKRQQTKENQVSASCVYIRGNEISPSCVKIAENEISPSCVKLNQSTMNIIITKVSPP